LATDQCLATRHTKESISHGQVEPKTHFSMLGAIGIQYSLTCAPLAIGFYLSMVIGLGGSPAYFWGFVVTGFFQLFVCLAVSELASAIPHSAGSYSVTTRATCI
jgi:amino acid transporter